jgi:recombination protein RecR
MAALDRLTECLSKLPGIGRRSAERMAVRLVAEPDGVLRELRAALDEAAATVRCCARCGGITTADRDPCRLCSSGDRADGTLCIVEQPNDILLIERSGGYRGRYHALHGKISPGRGEGPDALRIETLLRRVRAEGFTEAILALSTDMEGEATAGYLAELLRKEGLRVSRLAHGLPAGSGIVYSDPVTLARAIQGRVEA